MVPKEIEGNKQRIALVLPACHGIDHDPLHPSHLKHSQRPPELTNELSIEVDWWILSRGDLYAARIVKHGRCNFTSVCWYPICRNLLGQLSSSRRRAGNHEDRTYDHGDRGGCLTQPLFSTHKSHVRPSSAFPRLHPCNARPYQRLLL
jgi:hypothetical protein